MRARHLLRPPSIAGSLNSQLAGMRRPLVLFMLLGMLGCTMVTPLFAQVTKISGVVVNADKQPLPEARISCLAYSGDEANDFEPVYLQSDAAGQFEAEVPSKRFRLHVGAPNENYESAGRLGVRDGRLLAVYPGATGHQRDGTLQIQVTLQRSYELQFQVVDAETGREINASAVLYKDDEAFWISEYDYESHATYSTFCVKLQGQVEFKVPTRLNHRLAHILVLASGYEPLRLKLDETLKRGETLVKRVELQPLPELRFEVRTPGGKPAANARFVTLTPDEFRQTLWGKGSGQLRNLLDIRQATSATGIAQLPFPAFGEWVEYRVEHPTGYARLRREDYRVEKGKRGTLQHGVQLQPYAAIRGRYIPDVAPNEFLEVYRLKPNRLTVAGPAVRVELDAHGRFQLAPRLAGWHSFVHRVGYNDAKGREHTSAIAHHGPFKLEPGNTVDLRLGGTGRPVAGQLVLPSGMAWTGHQAVVHVSSGKFPDRPRPPSEIRDEQELAAWWQEFWNSERGINYRRYKGGSTVTDETGRIRWPVLPPGKYSLHATVTANGSGRLRTKRVEFEIDDVQGQGTLDLGDLAMQTSR